MLEMGWVGGWVEGRWTNQKQEQVLLIWSKCLNGWTRSYILSGLVCAIYMSLQYLPEC